MPTREEIDQRIKELGWSYSKVAKKAGVCQGTIFKLINTDTKHTYEIIAKICKALKLDPDHTFIHVQSLKTEIAAAKAPLDHEDELYLHHFKTMTREEKQDVLQYIEDKKHAKEYRKKLKAAGSEI